MVDLEKLKEKFALITIFIDAIDEILNYNSIILETKLRIKNTNSHYKRIMKQLDAIQKQIDVASTSKEHILKLAYGNQSFEDLDEYRDEIMQFSHKIIEGKFHFRDEN